MTYEMGGITCLALVKDDCTTSLAITEGYDRELQEQI
jgi:hypothetical protein